MIWHPPPPIKFSRQDTLEVICYCLSQHCDLVFFSGLPFKYSPCLPSEIWWDLASLGSPGQGYLTIQEIHSNSFFVMKNTWVVSKTSLYLSCIYLAEATIKNCIPKMLEKRWKILHLRVHHFLVAACFWLHSKLLLYCYLLLF